MGIARRWHLPPHVDVGRYAVGCAVPVRGRGAVEGRAGPEVMEQDTGRRWCSKSASRLGFAVSVVPAVLALGTARVVGQVPSRAPSAGVESVTVVPGSVYRTGALGRFFYGE